MEYFWDNSDDPDLSLRWIRTNEFIYPIVFKHLGLEPDSVKKLFDGGSGYGASLLVAGKYFKEAELYACSVGETPTPAVRAELGARLRFSDTEIKDQLKKDIKYDLVILSNVPGHELNTESDYLLLSSRVNSKGYVLEFGDTGLEKRKMQKGFVQIDAPDLPGTVRVWQKVG